MLYVLFYYFYLLLILYRGKKNKFKSIDFDKFNRKLWFKLLSLSAYITFCGPKRNIKTVDGFVNRDFPELHIFHGSAILFIFL